MGFLKRLLHIESGDKPLGMTPKKAAQLIKWEGVSKSETERVRGKLMDFLEEYEKLRESGGPMPYELTEIIDYIEKTLGMELDTLLKGKAIKTHDLEIGERHINNGIDLIRVLQSIVTDITF